MDFIMLKNTLQKIVTALFVVYIMINLTACQAKSLPKTYQSFTVDWYKNKGRFYYIETIFFSPELSYHQIEQRNGTKRTEFEVSEAELKQLYNEIRNNKFAKIKQYEELIYDGGRTSITLSIDDLQVEKSHGELLQIEQKWLQNYSTISAAIQNLAKKKIRSKKTEN